MTHGPVPIQAPAVGGHMLETEIYSAQLFPLMFWTRTTVRFQPDSVTVCDLSFLNCKKKLLHRDLDLLDWFSRFYLHTQVSKRWRDKKKKPKTFLVLKWPFICHFNPFIEANCAAAVELYYSSLSWTCIMVYITAWFLNFNVTVQCKNWS